MRRLALLPSISFIPDVGRWAGNTKRHPMTIGANTQFAMVASVLLATSAGACGGSTGSAPNDTLGSGGYGMPAGGFYPGTTGNGGGGGNGGLANAGAGGDAGNSAICPSGLGPPGPAGLGGSGGDVGAGGDGGIPSLTPGVHCDNTTTGNGNDDGGLAREWVCPVPSDPIWPAVLPNGTTTVGISPRLPCPSNLPALDATFSWTSENPVCHTTGGTFADPTAGFTTFTCQIAGDVTVTVYFGIRNTECAGEWSTVVHCHL